MKDPRVFVEQILESIERINGYIAQRSVEDFMAPGELQDAVIRRLEIIGEAATKLPEAFKAQHPEVPWSQISGMRNKLIHEYFGVDLGLTWRTVQKDLPELERQLGEILKELESKGL
ncbi:MAG: DUF86 domain-containing protein [Bacillota bacterium]